LEEAQMHPQQQVMRKGIFLSNKKLLKKFLN